MSLLQLAAGHATTDRPHFFTKSASRCLLRIGKLMAPLIRLGLRKQTKDAAANLKRLLEQKPH